MIGEIKAILTDYTSDKKSKSLFIAFILLTLGVCLTYVYSDPIITQRHGIAVWDAIIKGEFFHYYDYCAKETPFIAVYDFTIYLIFAIWNIPCWIYEHITGLNALDSAVCVIYGKLLMYVGYLLSVTLVYKISEDIQKNKSTQSRYSSKDITTYYACSGLLLLYCVYSGNYDIWSLIFILWGIDSLLDGNHLRFYILFAIATSIKTFALWIFIPLILLREKKIHHILIKIASCISVSIIENVIFRKAAFLNSLDGLEEWTTSNLFASVAGASSFQIGIGNISFCFVLYALLCIYCYSVSPEANEEYMVYNSLYVSTIAWMIFFLFVEFNSYWLVLIVPFLTIVILYNDRDTFLKVLLETIFSFGLIIHCLIRQSWIIGSEGEVQGHKLADSLFGLTGYEIGKTYTFGSLLKYLDGIIGFKDYIASAIVAVAIGLIVIAMPKRVFEKKNNIYILKKTNNTRIAVLTRNYLGIASFIIPSIVYIGQSFLMIMKN